MQQATIPAATVILMRDQPAGPPLILMVERAQALAFAGGALVFPGGRVDAADIVTARTPGLAQGFEALDDADAAARIAAAREALEETGMLLSAGPAPAAAELGQARATLASGPDSAEACTYAALLAGLGHHVEAGIFVAFGIWEPPAAAPIKRRFHTRFYIADVSHNTQSTTPDGYEAVSLHWLTAQGVLDRAATELVFPTRCMLARLAQYQSAAQAIADASNHFIQPEITTRGGTPWITIPEGKGYPWCGEPLAGVRRE
jgi:8-oxo-dGTP pyrophosphatase MutT (NUDIX family)